MALFDNLKTLSGKMTDSPAWSTRPAVNNKVLIIEDEKDLSEALAETLSANGFLVAQAANGQIGLDTAIAFKPAVILLDLMMPVMDGKNMLQQLRLLPEFKNLPVIVLTNAGNVENLHETELYYGVKDFLIKANVDMNEVVAKVKNLIHTS